MSMLTLTQGPCRAQLSPQRGAIITSLQLDGLEALYLDQATFDDPAKNVRGGIPVLFPICGPTAEATYSWKGTEHALKQHGFARNLEWQVIDLGRSYAVLELEDSEATHDGFPFAFRYQLEYRVNAEGLRIGGVIQNLGEEPMPLQFGFHPYFLVGEKAQLQFNLPVSEYQDNKSEAQGAFEGFDFTRDEIDWSFPSPSSTVSGYTDPERGLKVELESDPVYSNLVFWTLRDSPFVCLEPWSSRRLGFPQADDVVTIEPGEGISTSFEIKLARTSPA